MFLSCGAFAGFIQSTGFTLVFTFLCTGCCSRPITCLLRMCSLPCYCYPQGLEMSLDLDGRYLTNCISIFGLRFCFCCHGGGWSSALQCFSRSVSWPVVSRLLTGLF